MRLFVVAAILVGTALPAHGQTRLHADGAVGIAGDPQSPTPVHLGGTTWSSRLAVGADVSRRLAVEVEAAFTGDIDADPYQYRPSLDRRVDVETHGRRTVLSVLLKARAGVIEPLVGLGYARSTVRSHATFTDSGTDYFDSTRNVNGIALVSGLDIAAPVSPRLAVVPTFRVYIIERGDTPVFGNTASAGPVVFLAGLGVRVRF